ncbi:unnamed protein product [marine sediment metagenome]|uniref:Uncharacterized protein n=1 Tax=marine sediment metagenome TaxID=412755 RepID=X1NBF9_9ZZZZ
MRTTIIYDENGKKASIETDPSTMDMISNLLSVLGEKNIIDDDDIKKIKDRKKLL